MLFATDNMPPYQRAVEELRDLPLKDRAQEGWLGKIATRLLGRVGKRLAALRALVRVGDYSLTRDVQIHRTCEASYRARLGVPF